MINNCNLIGRLTKEIEIQTTKNGGVLTKFNVAIDNGYGENKKTIFPNFLAFGKIAEFLSNYCEKGDLLYLETEFDINKYTNKNGDKKEYSQFLVKKVKKLSSKNKKEEKKNQGFGELPDIDDPFSDLENDENPF